MQKIQANLNYKDKQIVIVGNNLKNLIYKLRNLSIDGRKFKAAIFIKTECENPIDLGYHWKQLDWGVFFAFDNDDWFLRNYISNQYFSKSIRINVYLIDEQTYSDENYRKYLKALDFIKAQQEDFQYVKQQNQQVKQQIKVSHKKYPNANLSSSASTNYQFLSSKLDKNQQQAINLENKSIIKNAQIQSPFVVNAQESLKTGQRQTIPIPEQKLQNQNKFTKQPENKKPPPPQIKNKQKNVIHIEKQQNLPSIKQQNQFVSNKKFQPIHQSVRKNQFINNNNDVNSTNRKNLIKIISIGKYEELRNVNKKK